MHLCCQESTEKVCLSYDVRIYSKTFIPRREPWSLNVQDPKRKSAIKQQCPVGPCPLRNISNFATFYTRTPQR